MKRGPRSESVPISPRITVPASLCKELTFKFYFVSFFKFYVPINFPVHLNKIASPYPFLVNSFAKVEQIKEWVYVCRALIKRFE
jgi:hypothetical protein